MKPHILLVEDDAMARLALSYRLQYAGYQVTEAADGETAIALLPQHTFELVISDIILGTVSGIDVLEAAKNQPYRPAVILLTGHATLETSIDAMRKGAHDYLLKPCTDDELLSSVSRALQRYHDERRLREVVVLLNDLYGKPELNRTVTASDLQKQTGYPIAPPALPVPRIGALTIGSSRQQVWFNGQPVHLTPIEYALLRYLATSPGDVRSYVDIVSHTHGYEVSDAEAQLLLKSHIRNLRHKLAPGYLVNDRGTGYKLVDPTHAPATDDDS